MSLLLLLLALPPLPGDTARESSFRYEQNQGSALVFFPAQPGRGEVVDVVYRSAEHLAGESRLHLRARLRTPNHSSYNTGMGSRNVTVLQRQDDGTYAGSFTVSGDVVYAAFVVEDVGAGRVDSREGRYWELLVHDDSGRPLFEALQQRFNDHMGRDELAVLESAREMARIYPERPNAWTSLRAAESWVLGEDGAEERTQVHQARIAAFDEDFRVRNDLTADEVGYMYWYARGELRPYWSERLLEEFPGHFFALQEQVNQLRAEHPDDPAAMVTGLEPLWELAVDDQGRERVLMPAFWAALEMEDVETILTWADRAAQSGQSAAWIAAVLTTNESTRERGIHLLREAIDEASSVPDTTRSLGATAAEHRTRATQRAASMRGDLGEALVAAGRLQEGITALEEAAQIGWDIERFRALGEALLESGDRTGALSHLAAVAADYATTTSSADSLRDTVGAEPAEWTEAVAAATTRMLGQTLATSRQDTLPAIRVTARGGGAADLADYFGESGSVVVIWSRYCSHSDRAMPSVAALAAELKAEDVALLAVTRDPIEEADAFLEEGGWDLQVFFDTQGEAARALNSWGTPQYFVLDGEGRLRFPFSSLRTIRRQMVSLQGKQH